MNEYIDFDLYKMKENENLSVLFSCDPSKLKMTLLLKPDALNAEMKVFLTKILESVSVRLNEECNIIVKNSKAGINFDEIFKHGRTNLVLSFGIDNHYYNFQAQLKNRIWNNFENFSLLIFDDLQTISGNQDLKRKLWEQLKLIHK
jgi:hypothetical protein